MIISHTFLQTWIVPRGISALAVLALILCKIYGLSFVELAITLKFEPRHGVPECSSSSGPTYSKWCEFFKFKVWAFWFIVHKLLFVCSLCCQCGTLIEPNPANMCVGCLRTRVDITEGIHKQATATVYFRKFCERYISNLSMLLPSLTCAEPPRKLYAW